jgi:hypothetical protein
MTKLTDKQVADIFKESGSHAWTDKEINHVEFYSALVISFLIISLIFIIKAIV